MTLVDGFVGERSGVGGGGAGGAIASPNFDLAKIREKSLKIRAKSVEI